MCVKLRQFGICCTVLIYSILLASCGVSNRNRMANNHGDKHGVEKDNVSTSAGSIDTVYIRDTVYDRDTLYVRDTIYSPVGRPIKKPTTSKPAYENVTLPSVNNGEYTLKNLYLVIHGTGESADREVARTRATLSAQDSLLSLVRKTVKFIIAKRNLQDISINEVTAYNTRVQAEKTQGYTNQEGRYIYRNTQTFKFEMQPILRDIYSRIKPPKSYSYRAFCRDFDYLVNQMEK